MSMCRTSSPRRYRRLLSGVLALVVFFSPAFAAADDVEFSGEFSSTFGVFLFTCLPDCEYIDHQNRNNLDLALDAELGDDVAARGAVSLRNENIPELRTVEDSADIANLQPLRIRVTDAWVEGRDLGIDGFDLRVGAQTVRWGTGDRFSPTDRLNPFDLSDPTYFDRRLATPAVHASYYRSSFTFSASWFPFFMPSLMSRRVIDTITDEEMEEDGHFADEIDGDLPEINRISTRANVPSQVLFESAVALRAEWAASWADVAAGWYLGRDHLPQLSGEVVPENFFDGETTDLIVNLAYPNLQMFAAEARVPFLESWTGWVDAALILPSRTEIFITRSRLEDLERLGAIDEAPDEDVTATTQSGDPYVNFLVGVDRSLGTAAYLNVQYLHGFLFERNPEDLHHYGLVGFNAPARFLPTFEIDIVAGVEANRSFDAFGLLNQTRLIYRPADALELSTSATVQIGQPGTTVSTFYELSEVRVGAAAFF